MSNKKTTTKNTSTKKTKRAPSVQSAGATSETTTDDTTASPAVAVRELDSRVPPVGTVIKKVDRHHKVRCQCTVAEDGIRYKGRLFASLSGAAMAAAQDLGLKNKTQNGFAFWGLVKLGRKLDDPAAALRKASTRFQKTAELAIKAATEENRPQVRAELENHENVIQGMLGEAAQ
jgi:hypothetical protein